MPEYPLTVGCHLSSAKGYLAMGEEALRLDANTFQFFTRNPRGGKARQADPADAAALAALCREHAFGPLVAHAPYTLNAAAPDGKTRDFARLCLGEDIARLELLLPNTLYNLHPGSHVGQGMQTGIARTAALLNELLCPEQTTIVLLETMAAQGSEIGGTFEQLAEIIARVTRPDKLGVCLDTCHVYAAGYDIKNDLDGVLAAFDRTIGLKKLRALHINDCLFGLGEHRDRHARLGEGTIGAEALLRLARHKALAGLPMILETPNEPEGYAREIRLLRGEDASI